MLPNLERYYRPKTLEEALSILGDHRDGSIVPLAGGTRLVPSGNKQIKQVVDLSSLKLNFVRLEASEIQIGATATLQDIVDHKKLTRTRCSTLAEACQATNASKMIRNAATIGGELVQSSTFSDLAMTLLSLDAELVIVADQRTPWKMPLANFLALGPKEAMQGGLLTEIRIPSSHENVGVSFIRLSQIVSSPTIMSISTLLALENEICARARISMTGIGPYPRRLTPIEAGLEGSPLDEERIELLSNKAPEHIQPISDARASADYRSMVSGVLVKRSLLQSLKNARRKKLKK